MSDDRLKGIVSKFQAAAAARDRRTAEANQKAQEVARIAEKARADWNGVRDRLIQQIEAINDELKGTGFQLHHGEPRQTGGDRIETYYVGFEQIAYEGINTRLLQIFAMKSGGAEWRYGTAHTMPKGGGKWQLASVTNEEIREAIFSFLEANLPT